MSTSRCGRYGAPMALLLAVVLGLAPPAAAQDLWPVALEINNYARVCASQAATSPEAARIKLLNASADPQDAAASSETARSVVAQLESLLSRFDSLSIVDPRVYGSSIDTIWNVWRTQSNLVSLAWDKISIDIVLLVQGGPASSLRFIVHNPRSGCTKYVTPVSLAAMVKTKPPDPTPTPVPTPSPPTPACGWYAIAFCRPHGNEAEVHQWNKQNARVQVIDTSSTAYPNFTRGWFCVASGPHDKSVAASIESQWKARGYRTAYIKNACK